MNEFIEQNRKRFLENLEKEGQNQPIEVDDGISEEEVITEIDEKFWESFKVVESEKPTPGTIIEGEVVAVRKGTLDSFLSEEQLEKWNKDPKSMTVEVEVMYEWNGYKNIRRKLLPLPTTNKISKNSNLYKWLKNYGSFPVKGQKVKLMANSDGFFRILL